MKNANSCLVAACLLGLGMLVSSATATAQSCPACPNIPSNISCTAQGFEISLLSFAINQTQGTSSWVYKVCKPAAGGTCVTPHDLSHFNLDLPGLGECLNEGQQVTFSHLITHAQNTSLAGLACVVERNDPSCRIRGRPAGDFMAKCDIATGNVEAGKCVVAQLTIAGEKPTLGPGAASTITKASNECGTDCILGPSCEPCSQPPPADECLTRTPGFWGTHPHITNRFLPVTVCGKTLAMVLAGTCDSASEALCVAPGSESKTNRAYAQLVRQLTAAKLNLNATAANDGKCDSAVDARIAQCEALCGADHATISDSGCIEDLTAFNESLDSFTSTPPPFDSPGPAQPKECNKANGNGRVIGKGICS